MELDVVIPSKRRKEKLTNCLNSLLISAKEIPLINIWLYLSLQDEYDYWSKIFYGIENIKVKLINDYKVPEFWSNHLKNTASDAMLMGNDDLLYFPDTLSTIIKEYTTRFPLYDGLMGIRQSNLTSKQALPGAFCVVGMKFADRFPNRQIMSPDYFRLFADHELWLYAKSINKFYFSSISQVQHLHPCTNHKLKDQTHRDVRFYLQQDKQTFEERQKKGFLWGRNFNLLTERT